MKWRYQINAQDSRKYICKEIIQLSILNWICARKKKQMKLFTARCNKKGIMKDQTYLIF